MSFRDRLLLPSLLTLALLASAPLMSASIARASAPSCHRYSSPGDVDARGLAREAGLDAELLALEHGGSFTSVSPAALHSFERSLPISRRQAARAHEHAYLLSASGTAGSYVVTARSLSGDTYSIRRQSSGTIERRARVCGVRRSW
jgi:hypothetical protein